MEQSVYGLCYYQLLSKSFIVKQKITWEEDFPKKSMEKFSIYHIFWTASKYLQKEASAAGSRVRKPLSATDAFAKSILVTKSRVINTVQ